MGHAITQVCQVLVWSGIKFLVILSLDLSGHVLVVGGHTSSRLEYALLSVQWMVLLFLTFFLFFFFTEPSRNPNVNVIFFCLVFNLYLCSPIFIFQRSCWYK